VPIDQPEFCDLVCFNLYQGWRRIQAIYRQAFPEGVTPPRAYLLCACGPGEATTVTSLLAVMGLDAAAMSGLLGRLEADRLLTRSVNPHDRREVLVTLTGAGVRLREQCLTALRGADQMLREQIDDRDAEGLKTVVDQLGRIT